LTKVLSNKDAEKPFIVNIFTNSR